MPPDGHAICVQVINDRRQCAAGPLQGPLFPGNNAGCCCLGATQWQYAGSELLDCLKRAIKRAPNSHHCCCARLAMLLAIAAARTPRRSHLAWCSSVMPVGQGGYAQPAQQQQLQLPLCRYQPHLVEVASQIRGHKRLQCQLQLPALHMLLLQTNRSLDF